MTESSAQAAIDKSAWGHGPWQGEPDRKEWHDEATGLPCLAVRVTFGGHWCGYVAVPPGHPAHGKGYDDVAARVHGGLSYANSCQGGVCHVAAEGEPEDVWWFGFDCAHWSDYMPAMRGASLGGTYRELSYVEHECKRLAQQLIQGVEDDD